MSEPSDSESRADHIVGAECGPIAPVRSAPARDALPAVAAGRDAEAAARLAHDLRSPLAAVLGFARLAREEIGADSSRADLLLTRLERSARTMEEILCGALHDSACSVPPADPCEVLEQIRGELKARLERHRIALSVPEEAPRLACRRADLYRILSNLIGNAIEHMGAPARPMLCVSFACDPSFAQLCVRDNGVGIRAAVIERIFEPSHSRRSTRGTARERHGLGLAIVRELAASWGGDAWVESECGAGAAFFVTIPLAREQS